MSGKFTYRLLISGMMVILITCILSFIVFYPRGKQFQAQSVKLSVAPNPASAGETIMVNGFEYPADAKVEIYVQDRANGIVHATTNKGGFFNAPLTLPKQYINGPAYIYTVSDNLSTRARLDFAKRAVTYTAPARRSTVTSFEGTGFVANESVNYVLTAGDNKITGTQSTDSQGRFVMAVKLPGMPLGSKATLTFTDNLKRKPVTIRVLYSPQILLGSFVGTANKTLIVTGKGYKGGEWVRIIFQGKQVALAHTDSNGGFLGAFRIPTTAGISSYYNDVQAIGESSQAVASDSFQVLPSVSSSVNTVVPGQEVSVTGSQFTAGKNVQVVLFSPTQGASSVGMALQNTSVSNEGKFQISFSIPLNAVRKKVYNVVYIDVASGMNVNTHFKVI